MGDDVVQFPCDPRPLRGPGLVGLALELRVAFGQRSVLSAGAHEHAGEPEGNEWRDGRA